MTTNTSYKIISKKDLPKSVLEIEIEIPWEGIAVHESKAIKHAQEHIEVPGFRKGNVPEAMVRERLGDMALVESMADYALQEIYPTLVEKEDIKGIGRPSVVITKIARQSPLSVRITTAVLPKIELPDYKKIAKGITLDSTDVTDADFNNLIEEARRNYARATHSYKENHVHDGEHKDEDLILPEINDEFVSKLGQFKDVADFHVKLKENLAKDKEMKARDKRRAEIASAILAATKIEVPDILVESEFDRMWGQMEGDITRAGLKVEDYLKHISKTREDIRTDWADDATKRAALQVLIAEIAIKEKIIPAEEKVKEQYDMILASQNDADPFRVKMYVEQILTNEAVFDFLEE